ncbi:hypothetical protein AX769_22600 (plasmid) [Frondihabitans sp. PAMC 28766]|nr:hypothetical protein AX769_22600 [Frondihabitans sp. PAMC 28766]
MFSMLLLAVIVFETVINMRVRQAVRGSRQRYLLMTQRRILSWTVNVGFLLQGIIGFFLGQPLAVVSVIFGVCLAYLEIKNHKDDDDWFNGRMKKIWKSVRKAFTVRIRVPSPSSAPSPVFG